jgi:hypothetical protein
MASPNSTNSNSNLSPSSLPLSSSDERSLLCTPRTRAAAKKAAELLAALKNKKVAVAKEPRSAKRSLSVVPEEPRKKVVAPTKAITLAKRRKTKKELKAEKMAEFLAADSRRPANFTAEEDVFLCRAYVNVSLDPAVGTDQSAETFWKKVKDKFTSLYKEERLHLVHLLHFSLGFRDTFRKMHSSLMHTINTMPTRNQAAGMRTVYSRVPVQGSLGLKDEPLNLKNVFQFFSML